MPPAYRTSGAAPDGTWTDWTMLGNPPGGLSEDITPVLTTGADSPLGLELFA